MHLPGWTKRAALLLVSLTSVTGATACVVDDKGPGLVESDDEVIEVRLLSDLRFSPADITIEPGTTVRWINTSNVFHTVTPQGHNEWERFTTFNAGETFEHTFEALGSFPYFCEPHVSLGMVGSVTVE